MKQVPRKDIHSNRKNEWRLKLSNMHVVLKEKEEDENDECKTELEPESRGKRSE